MMAMSRRNAFDRLRPVRRLTGPIEAAQVRRFGKSGLSIAFRTRVLVLRSTGRRSGRERSVTLAVHEEGDGSLLVVGGAGGQVRLPDWIANLRQQPIAAVALDRGRFRVRAEELAGTERAAIWSRLLQVWPQIDTYERRAGRDVPVVRLVRV